MKDKFMFFIIGLLVGSIITTGSIYFYTIAETKNNNNIPNMERPNDMGGNNQMNQNNENNNTPPEIPNGPMGQPPENQNN